MGSKKNLLQGSLDYSSDQLFTFSIQLESFFKYLCKIFVCLPLVFKKYIHRNLRIVLFDGRFGKFQAHYTFIFKY